MDRDGAGFAAQSGGFGPCPDEALIQGVMKSLGLHARAWRRIPDINRVRVPACAEHVKVGFALETELLPGLAAIAAADQAERIDEARARRGMTAAVEILGGSGEAHVVVRRAGRLGPFAIFIDCETVMARHHQALAVCAVGETMHMRERGARLRERGPAGE